MAARGTNRQFETTATGELVLSYEDGAEGFDLCAPSKSRSRYTRCASARALKSFTCFRSPTYPAHLSRTTRGRHAWKRSSVTTRLRRDLSIKGNTVAKERVRQAVKRWIHQEMQSGQWPLPSRKKQIPSNESSTSIAASSATPQMFSLILNPGEGEQSQGGEARGL